MPGKPWKSKRFKRYQRLGKRRIRKNKFALILILIVVLVVGIAYFTDAHSNSNLVKVYQELDKKDLDLQRMEGDTKEIAEAAAEIYCGSQLDKARDYFAQLGEKGLSLRVDSIKYGEIEVLKHDLDSAVLLVESSYQGAFVKAGKKDERARELAVDNLCQVELTKTAGDWKIADVIVLQEK